MNLDFSDDQKFLQSEAQKFLEKEQSLQRSRSVLDAQQALDIDLWQKIIAMGWTGIRIPEQYDGLGLGHLELCVIAEELGRSLAPVPFSSSVYLFTEAIIKFASNEIKQDLLPKLVNGECIGTVAITEQLLAPTAQNINTTAVNNAVSGTKIAVPDAGIATHVIVVCNGETGIELRLVELGDECSIQKQDTIDDSRGHFSIDFNNASSQLLGDQGEGWTLLQNLLDQAAVMFSFEQIGGAQAALDMATSYAQQRFAFGRAIGSYQAIKHKLADMYIKLTLAKSNSYYGAWALSTESVELNVAAATARVSATQAFDYCSQENIQTHGGNGFTWEYDCHLFYRRAKLLSLNVGSLATWKEKLIHGLEKAQPANVNQGV
ncbi:MAG: acyl-CoA/acyl-ACP dehydrogenase [Porticoccaceae bacterium]|jgi:alkylation response protein AidB-like acyl-CoA dehydrogenase|nr:acyl-CoA/acyl-ACP dehydrogenase [Porticoccaceae bacterium]MBT3798209.1 acyl-CoA/acyl-ACP dehydrogenase [Porticoccaceae bacterium]MBT4165291.1 acyl-CoA/acyl-ACP dehydrogenase [Porticoccaceae bacterium]MBT4210484.1 acyl-CoA/acyl-ACP dehydrogenase [Porticoccaceae bacterium]MBT4591612.1 acyl-CoA/acyl-ACP dehydrogenase [Porticoccaceae bacterium]